MQHHNSKLASEMNIVWIDQIASCGGILSRWCTRRPGTARRRPPSTAREEPLQNRQSRSHFVVESNAVRVIERRIALISDHLGDDVLRDVARPVFSHSDRSSSRCATSCWPAACVPRAADHQDPGWSIGLLARPPPRCACNLLLGYR